MAAEREPERSPALAIFSPRFWTADDYILERAALLESAHDALGWGFVILLNLLLVLDRIWQSTSTEWLGGILLVLSVANALYYEFRSKPYYIYDRNTLKLHRDAMQDTDASAMDTPIRSPNIRRRRTEVPSAVDSSRAGGAIRTAKNFLLRAAGRGAAVPMRDCLVVYKWDPHWASERLLHWFSPGQVMALWLLWPEEDYWHSKIETGPAAAGELVYRLRLSAALTALVTAVVLARVSAKHRQLEQDARLLAGEAYAETERYANRRLEAMRRTALAQLAAVSGTPPHADAEGRSAVQSPQAARRPPRDSD